MKDEKTVHQAKVDAFVECVYTTFYAGPADGPTYHKLQASIDEAYRLGSETMDSYTMSEGAEKAKQILDKAEKERVCTKNALDKHRIG